MRPDPVTGARRRALPALRRPHLRPQAGRGHGHGCIGQCRPHPAASGQPVAHECLRPARRSSPIHELRLRAPTLAPAPLASQPDHFLDEHSQSGAPDDLSRVVRALRVAGLAPAARAQDQTPADDRRGGALDGDRSVDDRLLRAASRLRSSRSRVRGRGRNRIHRHEPAVDGRLGHVRPQAHVGCGVAYGLVGLLS